MGAIVLESDIAVGRPAATVEGNVVTGLSRLFVVDGCRGGAYTEYDALRASGLPAPWTDHPVWPMCKLVAYDCQVMGDGKATVGCRYVTTQIVYLNGGVGTVDGATIRRSSFLESYETDMDRQGRPIIVSNYNDNATPAVNITQAKIQSGVLTLWRPQVATIISRVFPEPRYGGPDPDTVCTHYVGRTNAGTFAGRAPGTMLFWSFETDNAGMAGIAYRAQMVFRDKPNGWNPEVAWFDRETGEPGAQLLKAEGFDSRQISDPYTGYVGRKIVDGYEQVDWTFLFA